MLATKKTLLTFAARFAVGHLGLQPEATSRKSANTGRKEKEKSFAFGIATKKKVLTFAARFTTKPNALRPEAFREEFLTGPGGKGKKVFARVLQVEKLFLPLQPAPGRRPGEGKEKSASRLNGLRKREKKIESFACLAGKFFRPLHTEKQQRVVTVKQARHTRFPNGKALPKEIVL